MADKICRKIKAGRRPAASCATVAPGPVPDFAVRPPFPRRLTAIPKHAMLPNAQQK
jgi:hypothetical protein